MQFQNMFWLVGWTFQNEPQKFIFLLHNNQYLEHHPHWCSLCEPGKIFLTSKFSYLLFCDPTHKTETRTAYRCELLIANHMDQSLWLGNENQGAAVRSYLLHSSLAGAQLCCDFYQPQQSEQICRRKIIQDDFSSSSFNVQGGHILSIRWGCFYTVIYPHESAKKFKILRSKQTLTFYLCFCCTHLFYQTDLQLRSV
jgi:hypothetical protein